MDSGPVSSGEKVLKNTLILGKIFPYADLGDVKVIRQVCHLWNDEVLRMSKTFLHFNRDNEKEKVLDCLKKLDPRLANDITISRQSLLHPVIGRMDFAIVTLNLILPLNLQCLVTLECVLITDCLQNLINFKLTNSNNPNDLEYYSSGIHAYVPFIIRPKLKTIIVKHLYPYDRKSNMFLQLLIDSASNLDSLEIVDREGNGFPDLCQKTLLRSLSYTHGPNSSGHYIEGTGEPISRMLFQVNGWLQNLTLDAVGIAQTRQGIEWKVQIPEMPHLLQLTNKREDVFQW